MHHPFSPARWARDFGLFGGVIGFAAPFFVIFDPGFLMTALVRGPGGAALENVDTDVLDSLTGAQLYTPGDNTDEFGLVDVVVPAGTS